MFLSKNVLHTLFLYRIAKNIQFTLLATTHPQVDQKYFP